MLAASVAESYLLRPSPWMFFGVGLLEEAAKLAALAYCTRHLSVRSAQDGAILGAVLFSTAVRTGFRMTGRLVGAYLGVSILHGLWDSMDSIAVTVTYLLTGRPWQYRLLEEGYLPEPTANQVQIFTILSWTGLIVIAAAGVVFLVLILRRRGAEHV